MLYASGAAPPVHVWVPNKQPFVHCPEYHDQLGLLDEKGDDNVELYLCMDITFPYSRGDCLKAV